MVRGNMGESKRNGVGNLRKEEFSEERKGMCEESGRRGRGYIWLDVIRAMRCAKGWRWKYVRNKWKRSERMLVYSSTARC